MAIPKQDGIVYNQLPRRSSSKTRASSFASVLPLAHPTSRPRLSPRCTSVSFLPTTLRCPLLIRDQDPQPVVTGVVTRASLHPLDLAHTCSYPPQKSAGGRAAARGTGAAKGLRGAPVRTLLLLFAQTQSRRYGAWGCCSSPACAGDSLTTSSAPTGVPPPTRHSPAVTLPGVAHPAPTRAVPNLGRLGRRATSRSAGALSPSVPQRGWEATSGASPACVAHKYE
jgi:hypothetical protein